MGMEIERKFLIRELPSDLDSYESHEIEQGYVSTDPVIRIRRFDERYILTVKGPGRLSREEFELTISAESYARLKTKVEGRVISKTRTMIPFTDGLTIELDHFHEPMAGLYLAEVEFPDEEAASSFTPPAWFGEDVTGVEMYYNSAMSRM